MRLQGDDWSRKIPVEAKVLLMQLLNIESKVSKDEVNHNSFSNLLNQDNMADDFATLNENFVNAINSKSISLRDLFEQKPLLSENKTKVTLLNFVKFKKKI